MLGHDLPKSVNDRVILPFHEDFILTKLRRVAKIKPLQKFWKFTVIGDPIE